MPPRALLVPRGPARDAVVCFGRFAVFAVGAAGLELPANHMRVGGWALRVGTLFVCGLQEHSCVLELAVASCGCTSCGLRSAVAQEPSPAPNAELHLRRAVAKRTSCDVARVEESNPVTTVTLKVLKH